MDSLQEQHIQNHLLELRDKLNETINLSKSYTHLLDLKQQVEEALDKIENGTFGICELCKEEIEDDYLQTDPLVKICFSHLNEEQQRVIEKDLELAYQIQNNLLPEIRSDFPNFEISCHYEPLGPLSGDFYDVIKTQDGLFFLFGDVSGKGVSAALLMSNLNAIFRTLVAANLPLKNLIETANRLFSNSTLPSHYATLVCGRISSSGKAEISNAGHCLPLIIRNKKVTAIESTGLPVGIHYSANYDVKNFQLEAGDKLFLYTDGLTETRNSEGTEYGVQKLSNLLTEAGHLPTKELINRVLEDNKTFRAGQQRTDDMTVMAFHRKL
jgi:sigma-B regulation protein RsbU (phosphoserine phosphatase)